MGVFLFSKEAQKDETEHLTESRLICVFKQHLCSSFTPGTMIHFSQRRVLLGTLDLCSV